MKLFKIKIAENGENLDIYKIKDPVEIEKFDGKIKSKVDQDFLQEVVSINSDTYKSIQTTRADYDFGGEVGSGKSFITKINRDKDNFSYFCLITKVNDDQILLSCAS